MTLLVAFLLVVAVYSQKCPKSDRVCNRAGECCSSEGWCGTTDVHCNDQYDFGNAEGCPECICEGGGYTTTTEEQEEEDIQPQQKEEDIQPQEEEDGGEEVSVEVSVETEPFDQNCNCIIYGDPHAKMWNCAVNSWQGPHYADPPGNVYYMTRCNNIDIHSMPFDIIGVIQRHDLYFTSLNYTIIKLYDYKTEEDEGTGRAEICIKHKGNIGVVYDNECNGIYDNTPNENEVISVIKDKFDIEWKFENGYSELYIDIKDNECGIDLTIITQTASANYIYNEEATQIRVSDCYKAYTCGMCGDFYNTGLTFQKVDGTVIPLTTGAWGGTANDDKGLSYLIEGTMEEQAGQRRRRRLVDNVSIEPCYGLRDDIEKECNEQLRQYAQCCWDRKEFCQDLIISCGWDSCSCVMGNANNLTQANNENTVDLCVTSILNMSMNFVCGLQSDSFFNPDMSIYDTVDKENQVINNNNNTCDNCNINVIPTIFVGIFIGFIIFGIIAGLLYYFVIKPKVLDAHKKAHSDGEGVELDEENPNTTR